MDDAAGGPGAFVIEGYRDGFPVGVEWTNGMVTGSWRLVDALQNAVENAVPLEVCPDGRIVRAAFEPAEIACATILALLDGDIPASTRGDIPEPFRTEHSWARIA